MKLAIVLLSGWTLMGAGQVHVAYDEGVHDCLEYATTIEGVSGALISRDECTKWTDAEIRCSKSALLATMRNGSLERIRHTAKTCTEGDITLGECRPPDCVETPMRDKIHWNQTENKP